MTSTGLELLRPVAADGTLLRTVGGASVYRLAAFGGYYFDWVSFAADVETPVHEHPGIEHHIVVTGRIEGLYEDRRATFGPGEYFFWDGRRPHTSFAAASAPASMMMVRGENLRSPSDDYLVVRDQEVCSIFDGIGETEVRGAASEILQTRRKLFAIVLEQDAEVCVAGQRVQNAADRPVLVGRNPNALAVDISAHGRYTFVGLD